MKFTTKNLLSALTDDPSTQLPANVLDDLRKRTIDTEAQAVKLVNDFDNGRATSSN